MTSAIKWCLITSGSIAVIGFIVGTLGTALGMARAFNTLGASGIGSPEKLSSDISIVLASTASGLFVGIAGAVLFIIFLIYWLCTRSVSQSTGRQNTAEQDAAANP